MALSATRDRRVPRPRAEAACDGCRGRRRADCSWGAVLFAQRVRSRQGLFPGCTGAKTNGAPHSLSHIVQPIEAHLSLQDFRLWNRYGSCLSNGNRPEEALGAYREALRLRPTYTRAVYNVAVACMNIGAYKEAAEHLLDAIASQSAGGSGSSSSSAGGGSGASDQLWTTLRRVFSNMDRHDLAELTRERPSVEAFRGHGFDFAPSGSGGSGI
jgi:tetratricopeptide (TPR) repeat protein